MSFLSLEFDTVVKIATFLTLPEVQRLSMTSTKLWHTVGENALFWQEYLRARYGYYRVANTEGGKLTSSFRNNYQELIQQLEYDIKSCGIDYSLTNKIVVKHLDLLDGLRYTFLNYCDLDNEGIWEMEGHSGALILDRYWIIVSGWPMDEHFDNSALCLDLGHHNQISPDIYQADYDDTISIDGDYTSPIDQIFVQNIPQIPINRFVYGFTVSSLCLPDELDYLYNSSDKAPSNYSKRLILFGGLTLGGYRGDVNGMYTFDVSFFDAETNEEISDIDAFSCNYPIFSRARWSGNLTSHQRVDAAALVPITRGYHTANVIKLNGDRRCLVLFGGLHDHEPCNSLEIYDIDSNTWVYNGDNTTCSSLQQYVVSGAGPCGRFGHSSTLIGNKLYVCSGSDGNDLIRNGSELKDLYILEFSYAHNRLTWSQPIIPNNIPHFFYPGRCHTATVSGDKIFFFGGGASHSNDIVVFDTRTNALSLPELCVDEEGLFVTPRLSAIAVSRGVELFIFGGFSRDYGQFGDLWKVDLAFDLNATSIGGIRLMSNNEGSDECDDDEYDFDNY